MATTERQNRLLVAEDWTKIYQAFQQANFKSYDFETLRRTMVAYLKENYPDDFNDFVEGKNVKYWTSEPCGINPDTVSMTIDTDRYQQLMDSEDVG